MDRESVLCSILEKIVINQLVTFKHLILQNYWFNSIKFKRLNSESFSLGDTGEPTKNILLQASSCSVIPSLEKVVEWRKKEWKISTKTGIHSIS